MRSAVEGRCLTAPRGKKKDMVHKPVLAQHCRQYRNPAWNQQYWHFSGQGGADMLHCFTYHCVAAIGEIRHDDVCLDRGANATGNVMLLSCHGNGGNQRWIYNKK